MAVAKTKLEYISLSTGNWTTAVNSGDIDAVIMLSIEQSINAPAKADVILSNRSPNPSSSDPADAKGPLTDVFAEFQRIRLIHQEIGIPIFSGRIYSIRDVYDAQYGQTIRVVAFDALKELREFPIEDGAESLESVDTTDADEGGYDLRKRSQVIKYMLDELDLKDKNLLTTDVNQFEDSWSTDSLGDKKLNLTKLDRNVAGVINDLAISDPVKDNNGVAIGESGYDYRVEPRFVSSAITSKPIDSLHYFMRGTRPGKGGAYGASAAPVLTTTAHASNDLLTDSLTIEYTNEDSEEDSGIKQTMMPQYEFDKPKAELYTSVVCHYTDEGKEDESNSEESGGKTEGVVTFELLKGSALSGTFTWANKALDVDKPGVVNVPELLNISGGASGVARVQWQNTSSKYLLISNINESAFPTTGNITLVGASSSASFTFNAATGRMKTKYGVARPVRIQRPLSSNLGIIRDEIVSRLVGRTDLVIVRGKFQTVKYPIVYHELVNTATPPASTASRSSNTITWTGAIAAKLRGVRLGHIIAEMDSTGAYTRYAYISAVTNERSINYGASATDTSDGTALDATKVLRIIIPLRPGDIIKVVNIQSGVNTDQVILNLGYDESPGMFITRYETVGSNNKFNNIYEEGEELRATVAAITPKKFPDPKSLGETSFFFDGFVNRGTNPSGTNDYRQIHWTNAANDVSGTAGKLTMGDGKKFTIACTNSAILTTAEHTIFFRPLKARATANKSDTTFQVVLTTSYTKDPDDIQVGWCKASDNKAGAKAVLVLNPQFSSKDLFASGQNGTLTEALLSKSAQEYSSGLEIKPVTSGSDKHRQVTWAACTSAEERLTFGDGDYWSIAAKSGSNYSVTTNGSTYSNITALALSSTYYVFVDTADTASGGALTLRFTTSYSHISTASDGTFSSSKVIMGQIAVPANGDDGAAPRIFPFNNRSLTVNAASIAAEAITATHITASTVTTIRQGTTKSDVGLGNVDNDSTNTVRGGVTPLHVSDNMSGVTMDTNGNIYSGSKSSYGSNTAGWFIGIDSGTPKINIGSGSNRIRWTGSALEIIGTIQLTSGGDALSEANTFNANQAWSQVSGSGRPDDNATEGLGGTGFKTSDITTDLTGGSASAPTFTGTDTILDSKGICGFASNALQFYILASNGKAYFGGGNVIADSAGLRIGSDNSSGNNFLRWETPNEGDAFIYRVRTDTGGYGAGTTIFNSGTGATNEALVLVAESVHGGAGTSRLGSNSATYNYWTYAFINAITMGGSTSTDRYIYFNDTTSGAGSSSTFGIRSNDGDMEFKNDAGSWTPIVGGGSGDITAVYAGNGMQGGSTSGAATITLGTPSTLNGSSDNDVGTITHSHAITSYSTLIGGSSSDAQSLHTHGNLGGGGGLSYWEESGTTLRPTSTSGYDIGDSSKGVKYLTFENAKGIKVGSTVIWETHGHHEFEADVYIKSGNKLTCESELICQTYIDTVDLDVSGELDVVTLDVSGSLVKMDGLNSNNATYDIRMSSVGLLYKYSSSQRFKENIIDLNIDSSKIYDLEPRSFKWKDITIEDSTTVGETDFGYIAEEVHEILPQLVGYDDFEDGDNLPASVHYNQIPVLLIEELKKLRARIEILEGK